MKYIDSQGKKLLKLQRKLFSRTIPFIAIKIESHFFFHLQSDTDENFRSRHMDFNEIRTFPVNRFTALIEAQNL